MRKSYDVMKADFAAEIDRLANFAHATYMRGNLTPLYLVGRKADGIWLELSCEHEEADGWNCVRSEFLPRNITLDQMRGLIRDWLSHEPLWMFCWEETDAPWLPITPIITSGRIGVCRTGGVA